MHVSKNHRCIFWLPIVLIAIFTADTADAQTLDLLEKEIESIDKKKARDLSKSFKAEFGKDVIPGLLGKGVRRFQKKRNRVIALDLLVNRNRKSAKPILVKLASNKHLDKEFRLHALNLVSLYRDPKSISLYEPLLKHSDFEFRTAAIDAIGYLRQPQPRKGGFSPNLLTEPRIRLHDLIKENPHGVHPQANGYNSERISKQRTDQQTAGL